MRASLKSDERAERAHEIEARARQALVALAAQQLGRERQPEAAVHARDRAQRFAHDQRVLLRIAVGRELDLLAHVAAPAAGERFLLVAEVAQDRVVAAAAAFDPAHQLEEQLPLVLDQRRLGRDLVERAFDHAPAQRQVLRRGQQQAERRLRRRGRRGRPPGNTLRSSRAARGGSPRARRSDRRPCRTRWWRPARRARAAMNARWVSARRSGCRPAW